MWRSPSVGRLASCLATGAGGAACSRARAARRASLASPRIRLVLGCVDIGSRARDVSGPRDLARSFGGPQRRLSPAGEDPPASENPPSTTHRRTCRRDPDTRRMPTAPQPSGSPHPNAGKPQDAKRRVPFRSRRSNPIDNRLIREHRGKLDPGREPPLHVGAQPTRDLTWLKLIDPLGPVDRVPRAGCVGFCMVADWVGEVLANTRSLRFACREPCLCAGAGICAHRGSRGSLCPGPVARARRRESARTAPVVASHSLGSTALAGQSDRQRVLSAYHGRARVPDRTEPRFCA